MRLYNYLHEEKSIDKIKRMSEPFFKEFGNAYMSNDFIYRGHKDNIDTHKTKQRRKKRKPRKIDRELHEYLDDITMELFWWNARSQGIFCGDFGLAVEWGTPYVFIPLGNYRYIWTDDYYSVYRLYDSFGSANNQDMEERKEEIKDQLYKLYEENYSTKGLSRAVEQNADFEAIFDCDFYLLVNKDHWETLKEQLFD